MSKPRLSRQLSQLIKHYQVVPVSVGESPAHVYKLIGPGETLYLKISDEAYQGTTYDVEREKEVMVWLKGKLPVPEVLHFERYEGSSFLLMRELVGESLCAYAQRERNPKKVISLYSEAITLLQSVSLLDCPFVSDIDTRLRELEYLLQHNLADIDTENWEEDTPFTDPHELYTFLKSHKPGETWVFSHGDLGDSNLFIADHHISGFIDLGRSGKADLWYDIAFCVRSIRHDIGDDEAYLNLFFDSLNLEPDWDKIRYFILLDELF